MSVSFKKYVFRKIRGKIIPIRIGVERASEAINKAAEYTLSVLNKYPKSAEPPKKATFGRGIDFNVFTNDKLDFVMKMKRPTKGTSSKSFTNKFPELKDKIGLAKAASVNLPNWGIKTVPVSVVRLKGKLKGLAQEKVVAIHRNRENLGKFGVEYLRKRGLEILDEFGINIDAHAGNVDTSGRLIDTGLNLLRSRIKKVKNNQSAYDILGLDNAYPYSLKIEDATKPEILSDEALLYGVSKKALNTFNKAIKRGAIPALIGNNEYKLAVKKQKLIVPEKYKK